MNQPALTIPLQQTKMSDEEYHAMNAVSRSMLKILNDGSPAHLREYLDNPPPPTAAMEFGTAAHLALLQPELYGSRVVVVGGARTPKAKQENPDKTLILQKEASYVLGIRDSVLSSKLEFVDGEVVNARDIITPEHVETTLVWEDPVTKLRCKARPDIIFGDFIIDFKTCSSMKDFARYAVDSGYHMQAAFYIQGLSLTRGSLSTDFFFLVAEKEPPYAVKLFKCSKEFIAKGSEDIRKNLNVLAECMKTNEWPSYPTKAEELNLPWWCR